jgi:L-fuconolactonase
MPPPCPIVDTHVHWWDPERGVPLRWLDGAPALDRPFLPADLAAASAGHGLEGVVFVECDAAPGRHLDEARWASGLQAAEPRLGAVVAHAPLERGADARPDLEALARLPLVRGVRRLLQDEADDAFCLRPGFVEGVRLLPRHGFHFEICVYHRQLGAAVELVRRCPEVRFVLDHAGKPGIREGLLDPWRGQIEDLAGLPNVVCKLSGLVTEADHAAWTEADLSPYIEHLLATFGSARLMFGSDWPVSTLACPYPRWLEVVDRALARLAEPDRRRVYRDNAVDWYRMGATKT